MRDKIPVYNGDLFDASVVTVITTNGTLKKDGTLVMGRGNALQAKNMFKGIDFTLGWMVNRYGNIPHICHVSPIIVSFPVKHHWKDAADFKLIQRSMLNLVSIANQFMWDDLALPLPGCGNGGLKWEDVEKVLFPFWDERFRFFTNE